MKKILFVLAAVVTLSFASCGNKTVGYGAGATATDTTVVDSVAADSVAADSVAADSVAADSTVCPM